MPAKLWCDHAEGFESGLRAWELDVGEWRSASGTALADAVKVHSDDGSAALRTALLQWCYSSRNFAANPTVSAGNGTSVDDDRMQVDSLKKGKREGHRQTPQPERKSARPTRALQTSTRARTVAELDIGRRTAGDQVEEHTTIPPVTTATRRKSRVTEGKANAWTCGNESAF